MSHIKYIIANFLLLKKFYVKIVRNKGGHMIITITGMPCSGKSSIAKMIAEKHGFRRIGVGDMFKDEAKSRGLSAEEFNALCMKDPSYDFFIDNKTAELGKELEGQKIIFDSRLAWHFVPKSYKVYVNLQDEKVLVERMLSSDREGKEKFTSAEEVKRSVLNRQRLEDERYKKIYGVDISNPRNYDLVIDSSYKTVEALADEIWKEYQKFCEKQKA